MAHLDKRMVAAVLVLLMLLGSFAGCKIKVEDGGYQSNKIVDVLEDETTEPSTTVPEDKQDLVSTDGAIGRIVNGPADVYDKIEGTIISTLADGAKVITSERTVDWFHIQEGWVKAEYISLDPAEEEEGTVGYVNADQVNVRSGAGTDNGIVCKVTRNTMVIITETQEDKNKLQWGKFDQGWICMDYVTTDLFGVDALVIEEKVQEMGMAGEGGVINEHNYGQWVTIRSTQVVKGVAWGKIGDGWIDLSKTAFSTFDAKNLVGQWRSMETYDSWTFDSDGCFVFSEEDYEVVDEKLVQKGKASTKEGAYIYDGAKLMLYYATENGKKTGTSVHSDDVTISISGKELIFGGNSKDPLKKDLSLEEIYEEKFKPKSDPEAVAWIAGSWLYFSSCTTGEDGIKTAKGNLVTFGSDGSFTIKVCTFTGTPDELGALTWTMVGGNSTSGTYIYDGRDMKMTSNGTTRTVQMPKNSESPTLIAASGLEQIMASGSPDGTVGQTMRKASGTDDASLCALVATIFV